MQLEDVMQRLIDKIENSNGEWIKPFNNSMPMNFVSNTEYVGINILNLWMEAEEKGYNTNKWATFQQIKSKGGTVNKGEKATTIFFFKPLKIKEIDETGEKLEKTVPMLKTYLVWNLAQTNLKEETNINSEIVGLEEFVSNIGVEIRTSNSGAFYHPILDYINMPNINTFINSEFYYATLLHELAHSTGHKTRLDRDFSGKMGGTEEQLISYVKEELIAETARSFLQVKLGLNSTRMEQQNALYLKSWLKPLKENPKILWSIFSEASKVYGYVLGENQRREVVA